MSDKVDFVDARINGEDVRFRIDRKYAGFWEPTGGWFATMQRLLSGNWSVNDVTMTLQRAHPSFSRALADVPRAVERMGAATYAPLAATVIAAALAGIDPEAATWSDEDDSDAA